MNAAKKLAAFRSAKNNVEKAIRDLEKVANDSDAFMKWDAMSLRSDLQKFLSSDNGEAGLNALINLLSSKIE